MFEGSFLVVFALGGLLCLWVFLPLVPAVLIYKLFPDTRVGIGGPLGQLTLRATGAFAGYLATFLIALPFVHDVRLDISGLFDPVWTVNAEVIMIDKDGNPANDLRLLNEISVSFEPSFHLVTGNRLKLKVIGQKIQWPIMTVQVPGFGGDTIDLSNPGKEVEVDYSEKSIRFIEPLIVREFPGGGLGVGGPAS